MIYPRNNALKRWILDTYISRSIKNNFQGVEVYAAPIDPDKPVLLIANHFSYWDGLLLYNENKQITGKKFHVMLLEETAKQQPMLLYGGAFSVNKGSRDVVESIKFSARLLQDAGNMLLVFPQGKLHSNFSDAIRFEKGVLKIIAQASQNYQLIMAATFVETFQHKKPVASIYLTNAAQTRFDNIEQLEALYQQHYIASKQRQTEKIV